MNRAGDTIDEQISMLVEPTLHEMGFELVDVEYLGTGGRRVLRIYIDGPGGVTLDDCVQVSRQIGVLMDVKDIISERYVLEVSSPGLDRRLKKERDFAWAVGKKVRVRMRAPVEGRRNFAGHLLRMENGMIMMMVDKVEIVLPMRQIEKANLVYE